MANLFSARFDMTSSTQCDIDQWIIEGAVMDGTGTFYETNVKEGDIIYNDLTQLSLGYGRYKILSIDPETTFGYLKVIVQWDIAEDSLAEPCAGLPAIIGQSDGNGTTAISNSGINMVDEPFIAAVRNIESMRMSQKVSITSNLVTTISTSKEPKLGAPLKDLSYLVSTKTGQRSWKYIDPIDRAEKGAFGGVATLDLSGKIPVQQLPAITITDVYTAGNETEMLALNVQKGDVCIRTDTNKSYILQAEPGLVLANWIELASQGGTSGGGGTGGGTSSISNETRKIQSYRLLANYSIGEMVLYDNLLWIAKRGLFTVGEFDKNEWILVAGNMSSYTFDADADGIIDRANWADGAKYAMVSDEARMIQSWKPNTQYAVGEQLTYANEFWTVKAHFTSGTSFSDEYLEPLSLKKHSVLLELQGGLPATEEYYHLSAVEHDYLTTKFADYNNKLSYNGKVVGDMLISSYDPNGDGIVGAADTLNGLSSSITELNYTKGVTSNIQSQINVLKQGISIKGSVATYSALLAVGPNAPGDAYIVIADETHLDEVGTATKALYIWQGSSWSFLGSFTIQIRDFGINPLNIKTESIGVLPEFRVDALIARKTDLHNHPNKGLLDTYTFANSQVLDLLGKTHDHTNKSLLDTYTITNTEIADSAAKKHSHTNLTLLEKFSVDVDGKLLYNNALIEGTGSGGGGGTGITDLSSFTTSDLIDNTDKRYVTDAQLLNIKNIPTLASTQVADETKINDILTKIPAAASYSNKLATMADLAGKVGVTNFKSLTDVNPTFVANAFVVVNSSGSGLTYLNKIDMKIQKITDMDGNIFTNVPSLSFKELDGNILGDGTLEFTLPKLKNLHTTDLLDMPTAFETGKLLVSNASTMKYELKGIGDLTNSKANYASEINPGDWTYNSSESQYEKIVEHSLNSTNLIVSFYDVNQIVSITSYRILDENQIMVTSGAASYKKVVINCSQGTVGDGSGGGTGGSVAITASTFIDDTRLRLDKTFSSQHINDVLTAYPKKSTVYNRAEADALFATQANEHNHANKTVLDKLTVDALGNPVFDSKPLLTSINASTYQQHWTNQDETTALKTIIDTFAIYQAENMASILNSEFTIKNLIPSVSATIDNKPENLLRLVITDGTITLMDVDILPQSVQKYTLGISPNIKVLVQGKFDANYYVGAF